MTAIGAMSEGVDEAEVTRRVTNGLDAETIQAYGVDVRRWIIGPYHGPSSIDEIRIRALVLVELAAGSGGWPVPGAVKIEEPDPFTYKGGSVDDPAYSSPTPVAGERRPVRDPAPGEVEQSAPGAEPELPEGRVETTDGALADRRDVEVEEPGR